MMRKDALAAEHVAAADRNQSNGANHMEKMLTQYEPIGMGWSRAFALYVYIAWIVHVTVKTRMRFELASVG